MSSRGRNHTRGTMQGWRGMAKDDGYPVPRRWRWYVRVVAKQRGYTFTDSFLWTRYGVAKQRGYTFTDSFLWTRYGENTLALFGSLFR